MTSLRHLKVLLVPNIIHNNNQTTWQSSTWWSRLAMTFKRESSLTKSKQPRTSSSNMVRRKEKNKRKVLKARVFNHVESSYDRLMALLNTWKARLVLEQLKEYTLTRPLRRQKRALRDARKRASSESGRVAPKKDPQAVFIVNGNENHKR